MYPLALVHDLRPTVPWSIYALPIDIPEGSEPRVHERRFAVKWDEDNDERVLGAVLAAYYADPESVWNLYAVAEAKGFLTVFTQELTAARESAWTRAAEAPCIQDSWELEVVDRYEEIRRVGGSLQAQAAGERTRKFSADHDPLDSLVELFQLGPTGHRRAWTWSTAS
jgi:hypothetical protein